MIPYRAPRAQQGTVLEHHIIQYLETVFAYAIEKRASDIHLEPKQDQLTIRMRFDGLLHVVAEAPVEIAASLVSRIKILAKADIAQKHLPQDGRIHLAQHGIDLRMSTCPTLLGEKVVLRLLNAPQQKVGLSALGLDNDTLQQVQHALAQSQGLILVTGPTGSGKTFTLYCLLDQLNSTERNICTIEDPIEITLPGINQVAVQPKINFQFTQALRTFLRQDPDVIMVGEMRDNETADIAVKAAQTGHMVFSTLHTNSAEAAVTRLTQMGIERYLLDDALTLVIAQRLLRRLCPHCQQNAQPIGCGQCFGGYAGRIPVFECYPHGKQTLQQAAESLVDQALTSSAEVNRVLSWQA